MAGQLCWLPKFGTDGTLALHLRLEPFHPWKPHTAFPHLCAPDYLIPGGTKGWATCQKLLASGWTIIPAAQARKTVVAPRRQYEEYQQRPTFQLKIAD
jgi:hypothetical protein